MAHIPHLRFNHLREQKEILHASFLRIGGVSAPPFDTLNLGENVSDESDSVEKNISIVMEELGVKNLAKMKQIHGKKVCAVSKPGEYECDALISQSTDLVLMVRHADCQPALFYDPVTQTIGAVHAGWKGLTLNIYAETIKAMNAAYGVLPADLYVGIGPSLGPCHAEFINYLEEFPKELHRFRQENNHFDLREIAKMQLLEAGVKEERIEICTECTFDDAQKYFSYRREKETGRLGSVIALKAKESV